MKSSVINSLKYTGIVTLSQYIKGKKVKLSQVYNSGNNSLFDFIANCLVGDFDIAQVKRPTKIRLLKKDDDGTYKAASGFIFLLAKPEKVINTSTKLQAAVRFSFIVPADMLTKKFDSIALYTNDVSDLDNYVEDYAAICDVDDINTNTIVSSAVLVVDWDLIISNQTKPGEN